jgi:hypothetical protein
MIEGNRDLTYSSVNGVIFFSGASSSTNSFLYFSQLWPVALGILTGNPRELDGAIDLKMLMRDPRSLLLVLVW